MKRRVILATVISCASAICVHATDNTIHVKADVGIDRSKSPAKILIRLSFFKGNVQPENILTDRILKVNERVKDKDSYVLRRGKDVTVAIEEIRLRNYDSADETAGAVEIVPKEALKADTDYCVQVKSGVWHFKEGITPPSDDCVAVAKDDIKTELEYAGHRELKNKAELKSGSTTGAGSLRYTYNYDSPLSKYPAWLHFEALGKADFDLLSKDRTKYFNSIVGQVSGFYVDQWNAPSFFGGEASQRSSPYYIGLSANVESDQTFRTVDSTGGLQLRTFLKNPFTDLVYAILVHGDAKTTEAGVKPRFDLGYSYVGHIKDGANAHTGNERLTGGFSWWIPLLRNQRVSPLIADRVIDLDFLIDIGGIYDIEKSTVTDTTSLSLDLHLRKALEHTSDKDPSFTLNYAQGKATPTFKHFDALLVGLKFPF